MFVGDGVMASTSLAGAAAVFPACMHRDHNALPSQTDGQTDRQTDTDIVA